MGKRTRMEMNEEMRAIAIVKDFGNILKEIERLEERMAKLSDEKDVLLAMLESKRADDTMLHADLTAKYGEGSIDLRTFEWVNKDKEDERIQDA